MKSEKWYNQKLVNHFYDNYEEFENSSEWFVNPDINKFRFYLPDLGVTVTITCDDKGIVTEEKEGVAMDADKLYEIVKGSFRGYDAIYEDSIIDLISVQGLDILRSKRMLETCGSIDWRQLYVLI